MSAFFIGHPRETDLALFAGGEAGPFARWRIERHVETCKQCEQTVADFFHLSDELSPLADVPDVDWTAMARNIEARLAVEGPATETSRGVPSWTWQLGAAAACAMVAVAVWNVGPQAEKAAAPALEEAVADQAAAGQSIAKEDALEATSARGEITQESESSATPGRQIARRIASSEPVLEKKKEAPAEQVMLALGDRTDSNFADERFSTDAAAPPPPPAKPAPIDTESDLVRARESRAREIASAGARAPVSADGGLGFAAGVASNVAAKLEPEPVAFAVMPLPAAGEDMRVGSDGWISVRAISADGAMTITDVYEPQ